MIPGRIPVLLAAAALGIAACGGGAAAPQDGGSIAADAGDMADAALDAADAGDGADAGDAGDAGAVDAGPPLPLWSAEPFPEKRSPMPKNDAWASAPVVALDRSAPDALFRTREQGYFRCEARRLQEWIRIGCRMDGGIMLIGGNVDGFSLAGDGKAAVFPVRRGDRRVIEMFEGGTTVNRHTSEPIAQQALPYVVVSEQWLAGDERPTLVASDYTMRWR